jgi:hypothetical protein
MTKETIQVAVKAFSQCDLTASALNLFSALGYNTSRRSPLPEKTFDYLKNNYTLPGNFNTEKALADEWNYFDLLFQLSDTEISNQNELWENKQVDNKIIQ